MGLRVKIMRLAYALIAIHPTLRVDVGWVVFEGLRVGEVGRQGFSAWAVASAGRWHMGKCTRCANS